MILHVRDRAGQSGRPGRSGSYCAHTGCSAVRTSWQSLSSAWWSEPRRHRSAVPPQDAQHRVIAIHAARPEMPAFAAIDAEIQRVLSASFGSRVDYYAEYVDVARFADPSYVVALRDFLGHKYAKIDVDVVIATSASTFELARDNRALLFPDAAIVAIFSPSRNKGRQHDRRDLGHQHARQPRSGTGPAT